jgi:copper chaperone CopZ
MTHHYQLTGLTCDGCVAKVKYLLSAIPDITNIDINKNREEVSITTSSSVALATLQAALLPYPKYQILDNATQNNFSQNTENHLVAKNWLHTYKPILLIFTYISIVSFLVASDFMTFMRYFMAGFFLVFSFFKMLNLSGFVESYKMYDVVAKRFPAWGYLYAFTELGLGMAYLLNVAPKIVCIITVVVMSVSIVGVLQSVLNKKKIQCACLGAVFNLPMSAVTIYRR